MAKGFKHGGSSPLNFKVVGNPQPQNPKKNTIWIDTDVKITSCSFRATEHTEPIEGMVWFSTGRASDFEFNALKKNSIQVYPLFAKQYVGGVWVDVIAKIYQSGSWVGLAQEGALFWDGNQCIDVTGGWEQNPSSKAYGILNTGTVTFDDAIYLSSVSSSQSAIATTKKAIDFTNYKTLTVTVEEYAQGGAATGMISIHNSHPENVAQDATPLKHTFNKTGEITVDISGITGKKYLSVFVYHVTSAKIPRIRWE